MEDGKRRSAMDYIKLIFGSKIAGGSVVMRSPANCLPCVTKESSIHMLIISISEGGG
jgi:hypothetical protein